MIFKESLTRTHDRSGAGRIRAIHLYDGWVTKCGLNGSYIKSAIKTLSRLPPRIRGKRYRPLRPGFVVRSLLMCVSKQQTFKKTMTTSVFTYAGASVLFKKRGSFRSKYIYGMMQRPRKNLKFLSSFNAIL